MIEEKGRRCWLRDKRERKISGRANKFCRKTSLELGERELPLQNNIDIKERKKQNKSEYKKKFVTTWYYDSSTC